MTTVRSSWRPSVSDPRYDLATFVLIGVLLAFSDPIAVRRLSINAGLIGSMCSATLLVPRVVPMFYWLTEA